MIDLPSPPKRGDGFKAAMLENNVLERSSLSVSSANSSWPLPDVDTTTNQVNASAQFNQQTSDNVDDEAVKDIISPKTDFSKQKLVVSPSLPFSPMRTEDTNAGARERKFKGNDLGIDKVEEGKDKYDSIFSPGSQQGSKMAPSNSCGTLSEVDVELLSPNSIKDQFLAAGTCEDTNMSDNKFGSHGSASANEISEAGALDPGQKDLQPHMTKFCTDDDIKRRREALMHGLKRHLREKTSEHNCAEIQTGEDNNFEPSQNQSLSDYANDKSRILSTIEEENIFDLFDSTQSLSGDRNNFKPPTLNDGGVEQTDQASNNDQRLEDDLNSSHGIPCKADALPKRFFVRPHSIWGHTSSKIAPSQMSLPVTDPTDPYEDAAHRFGSGKTRTFPAPEWCKACCFYIYDVGRIWMMVAVTNTRIFGKTFVEYAGPYLSLLWRNLHKVLMYCWAKCSYLVGIVKDNIQTVILPSTTHYFKECKEDWYQMWTKSPKAAKAVAKWVTDMNKCFGLSVASLLVSMVTEIYPTAPSYNCAIAILQMFYQIEPLDWRENSKYHDILLTLTVIFSVCADADWLSSPILLQSLGEEGEIFAYRIQQEESLLRAFVWFGVLLNIPIKLHCMNVTLKSSTHGRNIREMFWNRVYAFIPYSSRYPKDFIVELHRRIHAILWIELCSAISFFVYFFAIELDSGSSSHFQDGTKPMLSLKGCLLLKGMSGSLAFLSIAHHIRMKDLCMHFGCNGLCGALSGETETRGRERTVKAIAKSKCILLMKAIDFAMGVLLWMSLESARKENRWDAPKDVTTIIGLVFVSLVFTHILVPLLGVVIVWYIKLANQSQEIIRREAMMENTPTSERVFTRRLAHFITSSTKRQNHRGSNHLPSREPSTHIDSESTPPSNRRDYDLNHNVGSSQSLFETRIKAASPPTPTTLNLKSPFETRTKSDSTLDLVTCSPGDFESEWKRLPRGAIFSCKIDKVRSLSDCHAHFNHRRFYIIASGIVGDETKLFLIAQRRVRYQSSNNRSSSTKTLLSRCLCQIRFHAASHEMNSEIRCREKKQIPYFVSALRLKELFGEFS